MGGGREEGKWSPGDEGETLLGLIRSLGGFRVAFTCSQILHAKGIRGNRPCAEGRPQHGAFGVQRPLWCDLVSGFTGIAIGWAVGERLTCWLRADVISQRAEACRVGTSHVGGGSCGHPSKDMGPQRRGLHMSVPC